jgi:ATP-binding cassette, subfamily B, bacterial PglK
MIYQTLLDIWDILSPTDRRRAGLLIVLLIVSAFFESVGLGMIVPLIGLMTAPEMVMSYTYMATIRQWLGSPSDIEFFFWVLSALNLLVMATTLFRLRLSWMQTKFLSDLKATTALALYKGYMNREWRFYAGHHSADLIQNITRESDLLTQYGFSSLLTLCREIIFLAVVGIMLVMIVPFQASLAIASLVPLGLVFQKLSRMRVDRWAKARQETEADRLKLVQESFSMMKEIHICHKQNRFINLFAESSIKLANIETNQSFMRQITRPTFELYALLTVSASIILLWTSGRSLAEISPILGLFAIALIKLLPSLNQLLISAHAIRYIAPTLTIIKPDILFSALTAAPPPKSQFPFKSELSIRSLYYTHDQAMGSVLNNLDLTIKAGEFIGIIGETGAGKSTLLDLMLGLIPPKKGCITADGVNIQTNLSGWQSQIGYIGQSIVLVDDTIRRNVAFAIGDDQIDEAKIWSALESAQISKLVRDFPQGLDTQIGERGARLSGGERQRLGIARALYSSPNILVLDEATSALDPDNEKLVMQAIEGLRGEMTIIMITHRQATLRNCDCVYKLENGVLFPIEPSRKVGQRVDSSLQI